MKLATGEPGAHQKASAHDSLAKKRAVGLSLPPFQSYRMQSSVEAQNLPVIKLDGNRVVGLGMSLEVLVELDL